MKKRKKYADGRVAVPDMPSDAISRLNVVADATAELAAEVKLVHERLALMRPRVGRAHSRLKRKCPRIRPRREADANGEMLLDDSSDVGSAGNALPARIECIDFSDPSASKPEGLEYYPEFFTLDEQRALLKVRLRAPHGLYYHPATLPPGCAHAPINKRYFAN